MALLWQHDNNFFLKYKKNSTNNICCPIIVLPLYFNTVSTDSYPFVDIITVIMNSKLVCCLNMNAKRASCLRNAQ